MSDQFSSQPVPLERERVFFASQQKSWQAMYSGKFVLVKDERLINTFDNAADAVAEGVKNFGGTPFLVRLVDHLEEKLFIPALAFGILRVPAAAI